MGCLVAVTLAACTSQLGDSPGQGGGAISLPDGGGGAPPADAAIGNPQPDAAPLAVPDAAVPADAADPAAACTAVYGDVPGFQLCTATPGQCQFIALNGDTSCATHCSARGGTCISVLDNKVGYCDMLEPDQTGIDCNTTGKNDLLCLCTVP